MIDMTAPNIMSEEAAAEYDPARSRRMFRVLKMIDQAWRGGVIVKPGAQPAVDPLMDVELWEIVG